jgi:hypothetical protein
MFTKDDLVELIKEKSLLQCEVDSRHIEMINEIFAIGVQCGINHAKDAIRWRINGEMWCDFIDQNMTEKEFNNAYS